MSSFWQTFDFFSNIERLNADHREKLFFALLECRATNEVGQNRRRKNRQKNGWGGRSKGPAETVRQKIWMSEPNEKTVLMSKKSRLFEVFVLSKMPDLFKLVEFSKTTSLFKLVGMIKTPGLFKLVKLVKMPGLFKLIELLKASDLFKLVELSKMLGDRLDCGKR